jgi:hypothetical protein
MGNTAVRAYACRSVRPMWACSRHLQLIYAAQTTAGMVRRKANGLRPDGSRDPFSDGQPAGDKTTAGDITEPYRACPARAALWQRPGTRGGREFR